MNYSRQHLLETAAILQALDIGAIDRMVEVLAGINMPMLVKLAKIRDEAPLEEAVAAAQAAGRKYVTIASRVLAGK